MPAFGKAPQRNPYADTLSARQPGLAEDLATWVGDKLGGSYQARLFGRNLFGAPGSTNPQWMAPVNLTPVGAAIQLRDAGQQMGQGNVFGGLGNAALAVVPIPAVAKGAKGLVGAAGKKAVQKGVKAVEKAANVGFDAYHGSPHEFTRFDSSKIGTGEGNQAFGRGSYLSETESVARSYRDIAPATIDPTDSPRRYAHTYLDIGKGDPRKAEELIRDQMRKTKEAASFLTDGGAKQMADLESALGLIRSGEVSKGHMYKVRVNADPNTFIDYDAPLRSQPPNVRAALGYTGAPPPPADPELRAIVERALREADGDPRQVGMVVDNDGGLYKRALAHAERNGIDHEHDAGGYIEQAAADYLKALEAGHASGDDLLKLYSGKEAELAQKGVPGVRYYDGGSRNLGEGTRNFVVFDPRIIDIMKRYGVAAPVAASILAQQLRQPQQARNPAQSSRSTAPANGTR